MSSGLSLTIRECRKEDIPKVLSIENASFDKPFTESLFRAFFAEFRQGFRVAICCDDLVGYSIIFPFRNEDSMVLTSLAVIPSNRRAKIGSALLKDAIALSNNLEVRRMILQVAKENVAAKDLYSKFGFRKTRDLHNYYGVGQDALEMEVAIGPSGAWSNRTR